MLRILRAAGVVGFLTAIAGTAGCPGCAGPRPAPPPGGHATCLEASNHRASLGCKFQDGFLARCNALGSTDFNDCVYAASACRDIDKCDPATKSQ